MVEREAVTTRRCAPNMVGVSEVPICDITKKSRRPQGPGHKGSSCGLWRVRSESLAGRGRRRGTIWEKHDFPTCSEGSSLSTFVQEETGSKKSGES